MVVHYPRTVWKNSYAEHEVTGKPYKKKEKKKGKEGLKRWFNESGRVWVKHERVRMGVC